MLWVHWSLCGVPWSGVSQELEFHDCARSESLYCLFSYSLQLITSLCSLPWAGAASLWGTFLTVEVLILMFENIWGMCCFFSTNVQQAQTENIPAPPLLVLLHRSVFPVCGPGPCWLCKLLLCSVLSHWMPSINQLFVVFVLGLWWLCLDSESSSGLLLTRRIWRGWSVSRKGMELGKGLRTRKSWGR